jgi:hypothetical protein
MIVVGLLPSPVPDVTASREKHLCPWTIQEGLETGVCGHKLVDRELQDPSQLLWRVSVHFPNESFLHLQQRIGSS